MVVYVDIFEVGARRHISSVSKLTSNQDIKSVRGSYPSDSR